MLILQYINLVFRFLLELGALAALGYWGFRKEIGIIMKIVLGTGAPFLIAVVWAIFGAPNSIVKLTANMHILLEMIVFGIPAFALYTAGKPRLAWIYGICMVINRLLMFLWEQ